MNRIERMKEILKTSPDFGKRVGYKMCVVDEFHDMKEQLEKEAKEYVKENTPLFNALGREMTYTYKYMKQAYLAAAEPREKRITELEAQIEKMKCCFNCKHSRTECEHCRTDKHEKWEIKEND